MSTTNTERAERLRRVQMAGRECVDTGRVVIGRAYVPPPSPIFDHAEKLQTALLEPRTAHEPHPVKRALGRFWSWC